MERQMASRPIPSTDHLGALAATEARAWLSTPYRHAHEAKGEGVDFFGLFRAVSRAVVGFAPALPSYSPDWNTDDWSGVDHLTGAVMMVAEPVPTDQLQPGDIILFAMSAKAPVKHLAIVSDVSGAEPRMIHAASGRPVVESWMGPWWSKRLVSAFRFVAPSAASLPRAA